MPGKTMNQIRENRSIVHRLARGWIADKARALEFGKGNRDIMTLLGNYHTSRQVQRALTFFQSRRTTLKTQRHDFPNTR